MDCIVETLSPSVLLSPVAILISAYIGAKVAISSIQEQRKIARLRATLDVILKSESDKYYQSIHREFISERKRKDGLDALIGAETEREQAARISVDNFLNHYELISISIIKKGVLDEEFYKNWMKSTFVKHFEESEKFIKKTRESAPNAFTEFEFLAKKWTDKSPS